MSNDLVEDEHRVEPVEGGGVKVVDLAGKASQASEGGHKFSRLHPSISCHLNSDNLPLQEPSFN